MTTETEIVETMRLLDREIEKRRKAMTIDDLVDELRMALSNTWDVAVREALVSSINALEKMSGPLTKAELELVERGLQEILGRPLDQAVKTQIFSLQEAAYLLGVVEVVGAGVEVAWGIADQKSLSVLNSNTLFWVDTYYDDNLQEGIRAVLQDYFDGGYNRKELVDLFQKHLGSLGDKGRSYWDMFADHTTTKVREIGRVSGYQQAGVKVVRVKARLDEKTSDICRRLHGHVISVEDLQGQVDGYLAACETKDKEKIKASWPWWDEKKSQKLTSAKVINRKVKRGEIGLPPYHGRCRTITVAEYYSNPGDHKLTERDIDNGAIG